MFCAFIFLSTKYPKSKELIFIFHFQMGTNYKAALIPQRIRETIHGWGRQLGGGGGLVILLMIPPYTQTQAQ